MKGKRLCERAVDFRGSENADMSSERRVKILARWMTSGSAGYVHRPRVGPKREMHCMQSNGLNGRYSALAFSRKNRGLSTNLRPLTAPFSQVDALACWDRTPCVGQRRSDAEG